MELLRLAAVFAVIVTLLSLRRPMYQAMLGGIAATLLLYRIPAAEWLRQPLEVVTNWSSLSVIISIYLITCLQRLMESREQIRLAQADLDGLVHNRRVNAAVAPMFIGLMPSAGAMLLCGEIVREATDSYLERKDQAVLTSWFRHIPESTLPTYAGVLLMAQLSKVPMGEYLLGMIVPNITMIALGWFFFLRKLPKDPGTAPSSKRARDAVHLVQHLWPLLLIILLIIGFKVSVTAALLISIVLAMLCYRSTPKELLTAFWTAVEPKLLINTTLVLVLKEFIDYTGVLQTVPELLDGLPLPPYLAFVIMFFIGPIISGSAGTIAMGTTLAFTALDGGMPLMVLLMCTVHASMQLSPTHVCLPVAAEDFQVTLGQLIRKTVPLSLIFLSLMLLYYHLLLFLVG